MEELLVHDIQQLFLDNQARYLVTKVLVVETGRIARASKRLGLENTRL